MKLVLPKIRLLNLCASNSEQSVSQNPRLVKDTDLLCDFQDQHSSISESTSIPAGQTVTRVPSVESASVQPVRRSGRRVPSDESVPTSVSSQGGSNFNKKKPPTWSRPGHPEWDIIRVLYSDDCLAEDPLRTIPNPDYEYLDRNGKLKQPNTYVPVPKPVKRLHPKLKALIQRGADTRSHHLYYGHMGLKRNIPTAGKIREDWEEPEESDEEPDPRGSEVRAAPLNFLAELKALSNQFTNDGSQEEQFHARPSIKLIIPDHIKAILVDDWENVTKNLQLVPLPAAKPVNLILNDYLNYEKPKRQAGSAQADILDEVVAGLKEYFEKCVGRILLYR